MFPVPDEGRPKITVDKECYDDANANLVASYFFAGDAATQITLQVFPVEDVLVFENHDGRPQELTVVIRDGVEPWLSTLSCGQPDTCHTWTARGGVELSTASLVAGGTEYAVVLLAQTNNDDDAGTLDTLAATSFRLGACDE